MSDQTQGQNGAENEWVLWALGGFLVLAGAVWGVVALATRATCGAFASPDSMIGAASFLWTADPAVLGTVEGCASEQSTVIISLGVLAAVAISLVIVIAVARARYKQSDRYFIKDVRDRENIAKAGELRKQNRVITKRAREVRPSIKRPKLPEAGLSFGQSQGQRVWSLFEDSVCLVGPPRSGKGLHLLISAIADAPGPVIATSSRADNYAATRELRAKRGPVTLFDPQGLTGQETQIKWSPLSGCENQRVANQRASSLVKASGLGASSENSVWQQPAIEILQSLLHAAALSRGTVADIFRWSSNPSAAQQAVEVLKDSRDSKDWGLALEGTIDGDPKMRDNKWFGVGAALSGLAVPEFRDAMTPAQWDQQFDIDDFLDNSGTLYIVGNESGGSSVGPFLIALMDAVTERAREKAARAPGNRLDPPLALVLDEIANIAAAWPGLAKLMADGGGSGIMPIAVFQSLAQARNQWGNGAAETIFDNATVSILLGGAKNTEDLEKIRDLIGTRRVVRRNRSDSKSGKSMSEQGEDVPVLRVDELRRLPFGYGVLLRRTGRAVFMELRRWQAHKESAQIKESMGRFNQSMLDELTSGKDEVSADPAPVNATPAPRGPEPEPGVMIR